MAEGRIAIGVYDPAWPQRFREVAAALRAGVALSALRIDHIGSTSVPGLDAKDVIDVQITVEDLGVADGWPDEMLPGLVRSSIAEDHQPAATPGDPAQWKKRYWSNASDTHVHVREAGMLNQRYALLFRDYLRSDKRAAGAYGAVKRALAAAAPENWDLYYGVKDPACDLIIAGAEHWAARIGWVQPPSDA